MTVGSFPQCVAKRLRDAWRTEIWENHCFPWRKVLVSLALQRVLGFVCQAANCKLFMIVVK